MHTVHVKNKINVWHEGGIVKAKKTKGFSTFSFFEELWLNQNCIQFIRGPIKACVQMTSLTVTCMPSSNLWCTRSQRSGQAYHIVLPRRLTTALRVCVASLQVEISTLKPDGTIE